ncbi:MAG: hypothetical protein LBQ41_01990 [Candidatus Ancillula sp.]|jgi:hypothetical protein|nr:hypothetical protein [Candidatus Ancillula sp.]
MKEEKVKMKRRVKTLITMLVVVALSLIAGVVDAKTAVAATNGCAVEADSGDFQCNIYRPGVKANNGYALDYGTYAFAQPGGEFAEGFCIAYGTTAGGNATDFNNMGALNLTKHGAANVPIQSKGLGETEDAKYILSYLANQYFSGALDGYGASSGLDPGRITNMTNGNPNHVFVAAALAYIVHSWFDIADASHLAVLSEFLNAAPDGIKQLANTLVSSVPTVAVNIEAPHIVYSGSNAYLVVKSSQPNLRAEGHTLTHTGDYYYTPTSASGSITFCVDVIYKVLTRAGHGESAGKPYQSSVYFESSEVTKSNCNTINYDDNFDLRINSSSMKTQRYVAGNIVDDVFWGYSGAWPCDLSDLGSTPGQCASFASFPVRATLYQLSSSDFPRATNLTPTVSQSSINPPPLTRPATGTTGQFSVNFGSRTTPGFYTSQISLTYGGSTQLHPENLAKTNDELVNETTSTYNCALKHSSYTSKYSIVRGESVDDTITISDRCRPFDLKDGALGAVDRAEVQLLGPLRVMPQPNLPSEHPKIICAAGDTCVARSVSVPLQNGKLHVKDYEPELSVTQAGLYVFVYHFAGDVFTPEFWSNAADGAEMFIVDSNHAQMWSKATPRVDADEDFFDTVYLTGPVRPGAFLTFDAYKASDPREMPTCEIKLFDGMSHPIIVNRDGGVYESPRIRSSELGEVYWVATLHEADGAVYKDYYDNTFETLQGKCGEKEETTTVGWTPSVFRTNAVEDAASGQPIWDTATINAVGGVPAGMKIRFEVFLDDGKPSAGVSVFSDTQPLLHLGTIKSQRWVPETPGRYYWVATILDQFDTVIAQGEYGDAEETSHVFKISTTTSRHYVQSGETAYDNIRVEGNVSEGLILRPKLFLKCESPGCLNDLEIETYQPDILLKEGVKDYKTSTLPFHNTGDYYWGYQILNLYGEILDQGAPREPSESFSVLGISSSSPRSVYIGEDFYDTVFLQGNYPANACIYWELYVQKDFVEHDVLTQRTDCTPITGDVMKSLEVNKTLPASYYWVAYVSLDNQIIAQGVRRDASETTEAKSLVGTVWTYSETPAKVYVGEHFQDIVQIKGRIPDEGFVIWDLYKQSASPDFLDDKLILTTKPVQFTKEDRTDDTTLRVKSPEVQLNEFGKYYWVEKVYTPLERAPIAVNKPRTVTESVEVMPLNSLVTTTSQAVDFTRVNQDFFDMVYLRFKDDTFPNCLLHDDKIVEPLLDSDAEPEKWCTRSDDIQKLLEQGTISWKIYRKNLKSDDPQNDVLILKTDEIPLTSGTLNSDNILEIRSATQNFETPGIYYWVEEIHSSLQPELVAQQEMRNVKETTVVEATNSKYVKVGARSATSAMNGNSLGQTGIGLGKLVGTVITVTAVALIMKMKGKRKWKRRRRRIWFGHSFWQY